MQTNLFHLFKTRRFLPLFITQFLGAFNDNVFKNAMVILITYRLAVSTSMNAQILVTIAGGIFILPFFLFSATAGQLADKYEKSRLISIVKFLEIILMSSAVVGFYNANVKLLMISLFLVGTQATFFGPLKYAILPEHLQENELIGGNGLIEAGTFLAILIGTIIGGLLILTHRGELFISVALISVAIGGWVSSWLVPKTTLHTPQLPVRYNFLFETVRIIQYSRERRDIFYAIMGISWFWSVGATFLAELPAFAKDSLHADQDVVTFFFALFSIGIGVGSLLCNKLLKSQVQMTYVPIATLGITIFTIDLCIAAHYASLQPVTALIGFKAFLQTFNGWRIVLDLLLIAISGGVYTVPLYTLLQQRSEKSHRARVIASNNIINALFMVVAAIVIVLMLKVGFTVNQVFLSVAIVNILMIFYLCQLLDEPLNWAEKLLNFIKYNRK